MTRRAPIRKRWIAVAALGVVLIATLLWGRPAWHVSRAWWRDVDRREATPPGYADDVSRLNRTAVNEVFDAPTDRKAAEAQLVALLDRARRENLRVSIAGARHSMGGHTIYPGGIVLNMLPFNAMRLNESTGVLTVGSGAMWADVIEHLDARGRSVAVMQSNSSFSVGGSMSVNCHGWTAGRPPIASTVASFRLLLADGRIVRCSASENAELFALALGGYGLFGVILDAELRTVPNECYRRQRFVIDARDFAAVFRAKVVDDPAAAMAYGRLCVAPSRFLDQIILNVFHPVPAPGGELPPLEREEPSRLARTVYRASAGDAYGKEFRWDQELRHDELPADGVFTRNRLLSESAEWFENRTADTTDILHEYFVPLDGFDAFIERVRAIVPAHGGDLLNVTLRDVRRDEVSFLRYADRDAVALVMVFVQPRTPEGDRKMEAMTRGLIDAALANGGRYYLPYRLHATPEQFRLAYPRAERFFELKRKHDPEEIFQNEFYLKYGRSFAATQPAP